MTDVLVLTIGAELPDLAVTWLDSGGVVIPFATDAHTFSLRIDTAPPFVKDDQAHFTPSDEAPNVTIAFADGELDDLVPGFYGGELWARRADGKDRQPMRFTVEVSAAVAVP